MEKIWIVFIAAIVGGMLPRILGNNSKFMRFALPFSASILLSICFIHIIPDTMEDLGHNSGIYILVGFLIQLLLEKYSHGVEHGHSHIPIRFSSAVFFGLGLHAIIEGVPLGYNFRDPMVKDNIVIGVSIHKLTEAFSLGVFLLSEPWKTWRYVLSVILFALVTPLSAYFFDYLGQSFYFITSMLPNLVAISIGSFLWISTTIFYESEDKNHDLRGTKLVAIILGMVCIITLDMMIGH